MRIDQIAAQTDEGRTRDHNEDCFLRLDDVPLFAVADGMGGMDSGEVASQVAVDTLAEFEADLQTAVERAAEERSANARLALGDLLESAFQAAHDAVTEESIRRHSRGMGTTLVGAAIVDDAALVAHVGDSRAYLYRNRELRQLTEDHSVAQLHYQHGRISKAELDTHPDRHKIYQAIGCGNRVDTELSEVDLQHGDVLMLCSDGLCGVLSHNALTRLMDPSNLEDTARRMIQAANRLGGPDNITVVLVSFCEEEQSTRVDTRRLLEKVFLFRTLMPAEIGLILPYLEEETFLPGEVLIQEGEPADSFFVILSGKVCITRADTHLVDLGAGAHLGELALARPGTLRSATVEALEETVVLELSRPHFRAVMMRRPGLGARLAMALLESVGDRLRDLTERISEAERVLRGMK